MTSRPSSAQTEPLPVVVIGAGPVGLAAAAHLRDRGLPFLVLEAGDAPGHAVREWGHVRTFTPWEYLVDPTAEKLLAPTGWTRPEGDVPPLGSELVSLYVEPLAAALGEHVQVHRRVTGISRDGMDKARTVGREARPLLLRVEDAEGREHELRARAVIDASGTWGQRNPLGSSGLPAPGEHAATPFLVGPLPDVLGRDRARFAGKRTLVVGAGHSAANTLLSLARLAEQAPGTEVVWAIRGSSPSKVYGGGAADELAARGQLGEGVRRLVETGAVRLLTDFAVTRLSVDDGAVTVEGTAGDGARSSVTVDGIAAATGFRPDLSILSEVQLDLHPGLEAPTRLAPLIDPQFHSCGTVPPHGHRDLAHPEPGLFIVGMKSYGRAPTFLITTGNEQVRSIVAALAGDASSADEVHLVLPETGVCTTNVQPVADETHRALPDGVAAQGFATGLPGGGTAATAALPA